MKYLFPSLILLLISLSDFSNCEPYDDIRNKLRVEFKGDAKIEVGNFYAGLEFHHSSPLPQRISFYYPVANSIDLSNDYWKRDSSFIMALGLETDGKKEWLGFGKYDFILTPYSVDFYKRDKEKSVKISYNFCKDKPAFVLTIQIENISAKKKNFRLLTNLEMSLHTSHSFRLKDKAESEYEPSTNSLFISYNDYEVQNARLFITNAGDKPASCSAVSKIKSLPVTNNRWWNKELWKTGNSMLQKDKGQIPTARFLYKKSLNKNGTLKIVQIIGSVKENEEKKTAHYLQNNYATEVKAFEDYVLDYVAAKNVVTGDDVLDRSVLWANALLAVTQHYIDGTIQPMPCPAEYNFYFTHDVLLTDLAAVKFDLPRVKKDLTFIMEHADKNYVIPHAYYWKDSSFKTELVTTDGWNHFWFIIASASYLQHSSDTEFGMKLYPYIKKSLEETLAGEKDGIMYAYRPDWWDIGRNYGPRAYMTILAIKALNDFVEMSRQLNVNSPDVDKYSGMADKMKQSMNEKLWSDERNYLISYYEDGSEDPHYYMGSLLAIYFNQLNTERSDKLLQTAEKYLLDKKIGVYTVYPMDFNKLLEFFKFAGNEAGDPHKYINGGIWSHSNAWYALALIKTGKKEEAIDFIKTTMTIEGITNSPNGQPAMYEYRNSDKENPEVYGEIDKPQFMWAAGWYLYCIHELFGK